MSSDESKPEALRSIAVDAPDEERAVSARRAPLRVIEGSSARSTETKPTAFIDKTKRPSIFRFKAFTIPPVLERERERRAALGETSTDPERIGTPEEEMPHALPVELPESAARPRRALLLSVGLGIAIVLTLFALLDIPRAASVASNTAQTEAPAAAASPTTRPPSGGTAVAIAPRTPSSVATVPTREPTESLNKQIHLPQQPLRPSPAAARSAAPSPPTRPESAPAPARTSPLPLDRDPLF